MNRELKPCPFCGSNDLELIIGDTPWLYHTIDCSGCPVSMEVDGGEELIINAWNTRITKP